MPATRRLRTANGPVASTGPARRRPAHACPGKRGQAPHDSAHSRRSRSASHATHETAPAQKRDQRLRLPGRGRHIGLHRSAARTTSIRDAAGLAAAARKMAHDAVTEPRPAGAPAKSRSDGRVQGHPRRLPFGSGTPRGRSPGRSPARIGGRPRGSASKICTSRRRGRAFHQRPVSTSRRRIPSA